MSQTCYGHSSPDAVILPYYAPCDTKAGSVSLCCETGQTCLTNGLCVSQSGVYYSGGCTDSTYKATICPKFCTTGDANWVVECHGSAVRDRDFCCSVNGTISTCCNTASNGLGLVAPVFSVQAGSTTSVGASTAPTSVSSDATISSSASITDAILSTPPPTATSQSHGSTGLSHNEKIDVGVVVTLGVLALTGTIYYTWWCIKRRKRRQARANAVPLHNLRGTSDKSGIPAAPTIGIAPTEVAGSQAGAEVEGSLVGPVEMDANQAPGVPRTPLPSGIVAPAVAPDNNPLNEPLAQPGSWYSPNLGNL